MPIVDIEIITLPDEHLPTGLARHLADALGDIFNSPPGNTWVRLHWLPNSDYAENGGPLSVSTRPVFVSILKAHQPSLPERQEEAHAVAAAVAGVCNRPGENVHVLYLPEGAGRLAFGGELL